MSILQSLRHWCQKGHWPTVYELGAGEVFLVCCAKGGRRSRALVPATLGAR